MARNAILQQFYASQKWIRFRSAIIAERGLVCEQCGRVIATPKDVTLHHTPIALTIDNVDDVMISLNPDNVKLICRDCHNKEHKRFGKVIKQVYIVYGCPCSGKTSYVTQFKERNDIVVDMDRLYEAITLLPAYDKPDQLISNIIGVYNYLIDNVKTRFGRWNTAWVVGGLPDKFKREKLADDLGAELIYCECGRDEAIARLEMDEDRRRIKDEYIRYIDEWWDKYTK
jgi:hypothetical protein